MAFSQKTWTDRVSAIPNGRKLTNSATGEVSIVTVLRDEGSVTVEGDAFNAENMNGLETRISDALANGKSLTILTQEEYDAISSHDSSVIYLVKE